MSLFHKEQELFSDQKIDPINEAVKLGDRHMAVSSLKTFLIKLELYFFKLS